MDRPLLVNAQFLIRLQFPMAYNFLMLLRNKSSDQTAFRKLMTNMDVVPMGNGDFMTYSPLLIVILALFTFFHGYARLLRFIGFQHEDIMSEDHQGQHQGN
jgi:hypothetical protein